MTSSVFSNAQTVTGNTSTEVRSEPPSPHVDSSGLRSEDVTENDNAQEEATNKNKRKKSGKRSWVWAHFNDFFCEVDEVTKAKCNYCAGVLRCDAHKHGITSLKNHYKSCKLKPHEVETTQQRLMLQPPRPNQRGGLVTWQFDQQKVMEAFCKIIIIDEMPFRTVEKRGFRLFLEAICPMFSIPNRKGLTKNVYQLYLNERSRLMSFLKAQSQGVSITTDTWTSIQRVNYMCLTVHFIDNDWNLHKRILNFCTISGHKGVDVGTDVEKCLTDWGLDKVSTITVDNASSNDTAVDYLAERFSGRRNGSILAKENMHMRCMAHILNLVVQDGLKDKNEAGCVARNRGAVRFIRSSPARYNKFKACVAREGLQTTKLLCLDVPTRWNSTYLMLEAALSLRRAFEDYECREREYALLESGVPSRSDWDRATHLVSILVHFFRLTNRVSGSLYVTSNTVFKEICAIDGHITKLMESKDVTLKSMATRMREKFDKYWGDTSKMNKVLYYAVVFDPRYKWDYLDFSIKRMYARSSDKGKGASLIKAVWEGLKKLFDEYKQVYDTPAQTIPDLSSRCGSSTSKDDIYDWHDDFFRMSAQSSRQVKSELEKYLQEEREPFVDDKDFNLLAWWKGESHRFPILSKMARDILAIPVSTVASEAAFSTGGRVLDAFRSSLSPRIVQTLICCQDWLREDYVPISVEEDLYELEQFDGDLKAMGCDSSTLEE